MSISTKTKTEYVALCDICGREVMTDSNPAYSGIAKKPKQFCSLHLREEDIWNGLQELGLSATETEFWKEVKKV